MKALHGTAIYTGGGQYSVIGELDNGYWFAGDNWGCNIFSRDVREYDEENGDLAFYWNPWCVLHDVTYMFDTKDIYEMYEDFCKRLDAKEDGITDGYEEYSNYIPGEVCEMIDFSYFEKRDEEDKA